MEIGQCIGVCRESVTRILGDLQRRHIAAFRGSILTIMDCGALETYAKSNAAVRESAVPVEVDKASGEAEMVDESPTVRRIRLVPLSPP